VLDLQDLDSANGVQRVLRYVSPDGKRQDTAHAYIHPRVRDGRHENLHVLVETQVERVLLEGTRAVGVVVRSNPVHQPDAAMTRHTIRARKLVVVSCGNCGSPGVLERSGIGGASVLRAAGVGPVVVDLPGVGSDFQDHQLTISVYRSSMGLRDTGDAMMQGIVDPIRLATTGDPFAGWNLMDNQVKYRPTDDEVASVGKSAFQEAWARAFRDVPNKPLAIFNRVNGYVFLLLALKICQRYVRICVSINH
jgi:choline dehydrogenase-like flavoprotein